MKNVNEINRAERLYKIFIYLVLGILAVLILVPVLWVMVASVKETTEHYGSPWAATSTGRTLWMPGTRPTWAATWSIPSPSPAWPWASC